MLKQIKFTNFRKFREFTLELKSGNILVGPNNAGKSSILDAVRILDACLKHTRNKNPQQISIDGIGIDFAYRLSDSAIPFSLANAVYNYSGDGARIEFTHENGAVASVILRSDALVLFFVRLNDRNIATGSKIRTAFPLDIVLIPTLAPLEPDEMYVTDDTVRKNSGNRLASRILRNIWLRRTEEEFSEYRDEISLSWPGVLLKKPELDRGERNLVRMFFAEKKIDREVQWAGFGFQAWIQIQTHLRRSTPSSLLIMDEPDIYLHPDLQRRLIQNIKNRFPQFMVATHAVEIINNAEAGEIVTIRSDVKSAKRIRSDEDYQAIYKYIGSGENAAFARIAKARKVIFVEGDDGRLLRRIAKQLNLRNLDAAESVPIIKLGGFSEWKKAAAAAWAVGKIMEIDIQIFCLFDRDFRSDAEIEDFIYRRGEEGMLCEVLSRKEIENYLIIPSIIQRAVAARMRSRGATEIPTLDEIDDLVMGVLEQLRNETHSKRMAEHQKFTKNNNPKLEIITIFQEFLHNFEENWKDPSYRLRSVPGKAALHGIREIVQSRWKVSISDTSIIEQMRISEIPQDLLAHLKKIDDFCSS